MNILLVNDDGIYAPGIQALANVLKKDHKVYVIAPERQMSGTSHSITFYGYLNYEKLDIIEGVESYVLNGTPSDCTKFGLQIILKGINIDLVISGINAGYNIGTDILYSGTVNASIEGGISKIKSIAVSQRYQLKDYSYSAEFVYKNLDKLCKMIDEKNHISLSINIPGLKDDLKGVKIARIGDIRYDDYYVYEENKGYHIMGEPVEGMVKSESDDVEVIKDNYITISFVKIDYNDKLSYEKYKDEKIEL
jgi:5'-nucleotidase